MSSINKSKFYDVTPVITAGAYSANDVVGGLLTLTGIVEQAYRTGIIQTAILVDAAKQEAETDLFLFDSEPSSIADNAAEAFTDADMNKCVGVITLSTYTTNANNSIAQNNNIGNLVQALNSGTDRTLYGYLVTRGTPTYGSTSDLKLRIGILLD